MAEHVHDQGVVRKETNEAHPDLSIVVPLLNEQDTLNPLYQQLTDALSGRYRYEIIFVDDGSSDNSLVILKGLHKKDTRVRIIRFRKNFGQTAALSAGFAHARGAVIAAIDADLQNDPADIPGLVEKLNEGYDVVSGWRKKRHDSVLRLLPSRIANRLISAITGVKLHDYGCTLKAYRREILAEIKLYGEMHRFIPALASWSGAAIAEVAVNHRPRTTGVAKYGLGRIWKVMLDLITVRFLQSFSTQPIQLFGGWGLVALLMGGFSGLAVVLMKIIKETDMTGNPLLYVTILFLLIGAQFIFMGLLAELQVRTYHESQDRPTYVIRELIETSEQAGKAQ